MDDAHYDLKFGVFFTSINKIISRKVLKSPISIGVQSVPPPRLMWSFRYLKCISVGLSHKTPKNVHPPNLDEVVDTIWYVIGCCETRSRSGKWSGCWVILCKFPRPTTITQFICHTLRFSNNVTKCSHLHPHVGMGMGHHPKSSPWT